MLWRVSEEGFLRSSILNGTTIWFLQAPDGLVVPDRLLPLGQNYFLSESLLTGNSKGQPAECNVKDPHICWSLCLVIEYSELCGAKIQNYCILQNMVFFCLVYSENILVQNNIETILV